MTALANIILPALSGIVLGAIYFGGLWLTLRRLSTSSQPALLVLGSYMGRLALCLAGFVLVAMTAGLQGILVCTAAFIAARLIIVRYWGKSSAALTRADEGC